MTETMDAVGRTALLTAAMRAEESRRPDRLHEDPYARTLSGEAGPKLLAEVADATFRPDAQRAMPDTCDVNAVRTRHFDDWLQRAARDRTQIVSAASGMDTRPYRLDWPRHVRYFEMDRPAVLGHKRELLAGVRPRAEHHMVATDLTDPEWEKLLEESGYDPALPSAWLLEGVLYYLAEADVEQLLARIRRVTAPGSVVAADVVNSEALTLRHARGQLDVFARWGCPWRFGVDEPEALFARHGMTTEVSQPGEPGADFGRWPYPVPPRDAPGVRRIFLVHGTRH